MVRELGDSTINIGSQLTEEQQKELLEFLEKHRKVFATKASDLGLVDVVQHRIDTGDSPPAKMPLYNVRPDMRVVIF